MINTIIILAIVLILFIILFFAMNHEYYSAYNYNHRAPKIIHLIYLPWDKDQKLKDNYLDFDQTSYERLKNNHPDYLVKLWTLPDIKKFLHDFYPEYYNIILNLPRPVMIVDFMRLLLVYHYGGIYWQYGSEPTVEMDRFLPSEGKNVKLFTEVILTPKFADDMKNEPIRNGEPEELVRVFSAVFSATPKHPYMIKLFLTAIDNSKKYTVKNDYDILYIGSNAMMSTAYDKIGKHEDDIELVDYDTCKKMIKINSKSSWRMNKL